LATSIVSVQGNEKFSSFLCVSHRALTQSRPMLKTKRGIEIMWLYCNLVWFVFCNINKIRPLITASFVLFIRFTEEKKWKRIILFRSCIRYILAANVLMPAHKNDEKTFHQPACRLSRSSDSELIYVKTFNAFCEKLILMQRLLISLNFYSMAISRTQQGVSMFNL
jgi:hypothetical protein